MAKGASLTLPRKHIPLALGSGALIGTHWLCFFGAVEVSNISVGLAGFAATALFTALLEPLLARQRPNLGKIILSLLTVAGIVIIAASKTQVPRAGLGLGLALLGAFLASVYSISSKKLVDAKLPGATLMLYQIPSSCLCSGLAILLVPSFSWQWPQSSDWIPLISLAGFCTFFAYIWYAKLLQSISVYSSNLAFNFEPVYGMIMAAVFFKEYESLTPSFYLGSAIIVAANLLHARSPDY